MLISTVLHKLSHPQLQKLSRGGAKLGMGCRRLYNTERGYRGSSPTAVRPSDPALCGSCPL